MPKHIILTDAALEPADILIVPRSAVPQVIRDLEPGEYTVRNTSAPVSGVVTEAAIAQPPMVTTPAAITPATGLQVGSTVALSFGTAVGAPAPVGSFRLLRGGVDISSQVSGEQFTFTQPGSYVLEVTWTNAHGTAQSVTSAVMVEGIPLEPQIRVASDISNRSVHSGHSLTDAYTYGNGWPGDLNLIREAIFGDSTEGPPLKIGRSTIPGSPMSWRWDNLSGSGVDERRDAADFDTLMITEGGPPPRISETAEMASSLDYLCRFAANQVVSGAGDEVIIWSIWPALQGPGTDDANPVPRGVWEGFTFRSGLEEYWRSFRYMADFATWKIKTLYPALPADWRVWMFPGDRWMAQLYDDIQEGTAPGFADIGDVFSDNIHPDNPAMYGLGCFVAVCLYQVDLRDVDGMYIPETVTQAQAEYFWGLAWDIATRFEPVGMGGSEGIAPAWTPAMGDPLPDWTFDGATPPDPVDPDPEEPTDPEPAELPDSLIRLSRLGFESDAATITQGTVPAPAGGILPFTPENRLQFDFTTPLSGTGPYYAAFRLRHTAIGGQGIKNVFSLRSSEVQGWEGGGSVSIELNGYLSPLQYYLQTGTANEQLFVISGAATLNEWITFEVWVDDGIATVARNGATLGSNQVMRPGAVLNGHINGDTGTDMDFEFSGLFMADAIPTTAERAAIRSWLVSPA